MEICSERYWLNCYRRGNSYEKGGQRYLYIYELALRMGNYFDFVKNFIGSTQPVPAQVEYVTKHRIRVKDSVNSVYWFAKDAKKGKLITREFLLSIPMG